MEEKEVDLIEYINVIRRWKRFIIVGTLVCIAAAVVVSLMLPVTYRTTVILKIGKRLELAPFTSTSTLFNYFESPVDLVKIIPVKYKQDSKDAFGYHLSVNVIAMTSMLNITMTGPDPGVEQCLKDIINRIIDEHQGKINGSVAPYNQLINKLETDAKVIMENIALAERRISEMNNKANTSLEKITGAEAGIKEGVLSDDRSTFLNTWYLMTLNKEEELSQSRKDLRSIQGELIKYRTLVSNLKEYNTELVSKINFTAVKSKMKRNIILAGVIGIIMSLLLAFFIEYIWTAIKENGGPVQR